MENEIQTPEENQVRDAARHDPANRRASSLPLLLTIISLLVWFGFQTVQLVLERSELSSMKGGLEEAMQESQKVRAQLETLISKTADFANQGNASAKIVVEELRKRGIPIKAATQPSK